MTKLKCTVSEFSKVLYSSTLSKEQREIIIKLLPTMTNEQINATFDLLRENAGEMEKILLKQKTENEQAIFKMEREISKIKNSNNA